MAMKPDKVTVPSPPLRSEPAGFAAKAEAWVAWIAGTFAGYLADVVNYVDEAADDVALAAVLPQAQVWATATAYVLNDVVQFSGYYYRCLIPHTSGAFATDRDTNGYWDLIGAERFDLNGNSIALATGSAGAYEIAAAETIQGYQNGLAFVVVANHQNPGAATLNVDGLGDVDILKYNSSGVLIQLDAGDISAYETHEFIHNGSQFVLKSQPLRELITGPALLPTSGGDFDTQIVGGTFDVIGNWINGPLGTGVNTYAATMNVFVRNDTAGAYVTQIVFIENANIAQVWTRVATGAGPTWGVWKQLGQAIGDGQIWQDVSGSRAANTWYQNDTGRSIMVSIDWQSFGVLQMFEIGTDGVTGVPVGRVGFDSGDPATSWIIPAGHYYRINGTSGVVEAWAELR